MSSIDRLGTSIEHNNKAKHDLSLAEILLKKKKYLDWCLVSLFYFALHIVNSYARNHGVMTFKPNKTEKISAHHKRVIYVEQNIGGFFTIYNRLYDRSRQCRYDPNYYKKIKYDYVKKTYEATIFKAERMFLFKK